MLVVDSIKSLIGPDQESDETQGELNTMFHTFQRISDEVHVTHCAAV